MAKAAGPHGRLRFRLLAGHVEHFDTFLAETHGRVEQNRRLADTRIAAQQHEAAGHDAAAQHAVELPDARHEAGNRLGRHAAYGLGFAAGNETDEPFILRPRPDFFHQGVPRAAFGALSQPGRCHIAAVLADIIGLHLGLRHGQAPQPPAPACRSPSFS